jgi:hypothetical protein
VPTPLFLTGFEHQILVVGGDTSGPWSELTGTAPITSTTQRGNGARSMLAALPASVATQKQLRRTTVTQTRVAGRFYFRKSADPSVNVTIFRMLPFTSSL